MSGLEGRGLRAGAEYSPFRVIGADGRPVERNAIKFAALPPVERLQPPNQVKESMGNPVASPIQFPSQASKSIPPSVSQERVRKSTKLDGDRHDGMAATASKKLWGRPSGTSNAMIAESAAVVDAAKSSTPRSVQGLFGKIFFTRRDDRSARYTVRLRDSFAQSTAKIMPRGDVGLPCC
jgi:hypothetical protein